MFATFFYSFHADYIDYIKIILTENLCSLCKKTAISITLNFNHLCSK